MKRSAVLFVPHATLVRYDSTMDTDVEDTDVQITAQAANRQLNMLARKMCSHIKHLQRALQTVSPAVSPAVSPSVSPARSPTAAAMGAHQQTLLWSLALVLTRFNESGSGTDGGRLRRCLSELSLVEQQNVAAARAATQIRVLLQATDVGAAVRQLARHPGTPYPLVHFFEQLMAGSDPSLRRAHGAYFTPYPLVQYMVRSVDQLLQRRLQIAGGLSTRQTQLCVVDPACGSGIFLLGILDHLRGELKGVDELAGELAVEQWRQAHQLVGIDVMPASCGAAELLVEHSLSMSRDATNSGALPASWLAHCGNPLQDVTLSQQLFASCVPVIIGNPPYNNFGRHNRGAWIMEQLDDYKQGLQEKKLNLDDDFIKFIRWAQCSIDQEGRGIVALVTSNTYLNGLTHRRMRASLADTFDQMYLLDLHGSRKKRETTPGGQPDENIFPVQQGVAVGLFVKTGASPSSRCLMHADLWGTREAKLKMLADRDFASTAWTPLVAASPNYFFVPRPDQNDDVYQSWPRLTDIFENHVSGVQTKRDKLFVGFTRKDVEEQVRPFLQRAEAGEFDADVPQWLRLKTPNVTFDRRFIRPYMVAPFDVRWVYYDPRLLGRARHRLLRYLGQNNVALVFMRQATTKPPYDHFLATNVLVSDRVFYSAHGAPFVAPLLLGAGKQVVSNLQGDFLQQFAQHVGISFTYEEDTLPRQFGARDILHWIYAAVHDPLYREQYHALLTIDFPRVPWPNNRMHFVQLCERGRRLVRSHLDVTSAAARSDDGVPLTTASVELAGGFPRWDSERLALNGQFVWPEPVSATAWNARIGGYPVLSRWLKQRQGRLLDRQDLCHLRRMINLLGK